MNMGQYQQWRRDGNPGLMTSSDAAYAEAKRIMDAAYARHEAPNHPTPAQRKLTFRQQLEEAVDLAFRSVGWRCWACDKAVSEDDLARVCRGCA